MPLFHSIDAVFFFAERYVYLCRWTVSEQEKLTTQEALATAEMAASDWTPHNLATFMGTMRSQHKLQASAAEPSSVAAVLCRHSSLLLTYRLFEGVDEKGSYLLEYAEKRSYAFSWLLSLVHVWT